MQEPKLLCLLPEEYAVTPDGMEIDKEGNLILSCPNFADMSKPSCICKVDTKGNVRKWFDVPLSEKTGEARAMGLAYGPDDDLYIVDNQGWGNDARLAFQGRIIRVRMNGDVIEKTTVVADGMEHPNGIRIQGDYIYVTQSLLTKVKTKSGNLLSCVYRFHLDDENIQITNTLEDENIFVTYETYNPDDQYGMDGIVFDKAGNLYVGNFGDGEVFKIRFNPDGSIKENVSFAKDPENLRSTDGMTIDEYGNIYVADFVVNAIAKIDPSGKVTRIAQSPDTDGVNGELDQPGEPCVWNGKIAVSCFDCVTGGDKVNTAHELPATMSLLEIEP
ncbi:MAG: SMP-30/gluconolactonase/LRE family protein [Lachnospiraceae bacterium]|nr:SMP-30/gluconolactonase/LRE family protein [Lachnospiraceae bacterium]